MAKTGRDFYAILGVPRDADENQLKKAYKKLAMKWHPDKNMKNKEEAEAKFKDVGQAFAVLSDPKLRKVYDQYGEEGLNAGMTGDENIPQGSFGGTNTGYTYADFDPNEIFAQFFGSGMGKGGQTFFFSSGNPRSSMNFNRGGPGMKGTGMPGGFSSMFSGGGFEPMDVEFQEPAGRHSHGAQVKRKREKQNPCVKDVYATLEEIFTGATKKLKVSRRVVQPSGDYGQASKVLEIPIKPGMKPGTKFTFHQEGDESLTHETQDLVFVLKEKPHPSFVRDGDDLVQTVTISLQQALEGTSMTIPTIDGKTLRITSDPMSFSTEKKTLPGQGMPNSKTQKRGDMYINFKIKFPSKGGSVRQKVLNALESTA